MATKKPAPYNQPASASPAVKKNPVVNVPYPSLPQTYAGSNLPDIAGKGLSDIRKPSGKPFSGISASAVREKLNKRRQQTIDRPSIPGETI